MKKWKNRLDEMQEQKMLRVEHNGCWIAFWGLLIALMAQLIYYGPAGKDQIMGEFIVFMCLALYIPIGCVRQGIWDRRLAPTWKTNLLASLLAGIVGGAIRFFVSYRMYRAAEAGLYAGILIGLCIFVACFVLLSIMLLFYRWKENRMEKEDS